MSMEPEPLIIVVLGTRSNDLESVIACSRVLDWMIIVNYKFFSLYENPSKILPSLFIENQSGNS
jgi:hypothetical protein